MKIRPLPPGKYVVAVSGGVDSVVLLDVLSKQPDVDIVVAHVDHGIRKVSDKDAKLVEDLADHYGYDFELITLRLGQGASEELARNHRYKFLRQVAKKHHASNIVTAHHQDDVIETCLINLTRGTGSRGLSSLKSTTEISRPFLYFSKKEIIKYAKDNNLQWNEDVTNADTKHLRNKIRHDVVPKMTSRQRSDIIDIIYNANQINSSLDKELQKLLYKGLHKGQPVLNRVWFSLLPHDVSTEVTRKLLLENGAKDINKKAIERVVVGIKTLPAGKTLQACGVDIVLTKRSARLKKHSKTGKKQV